MFPRSMHNLGKLFIVLLVAVTIVLTYTQLNGITRLNLKFNLKDLQLDPAERRLLFIETTAGEFCPNFRQSCAVESAARHNPNVSVIFFLRASKIPENCEVVSQLQRIPNVKIIPYTLSEIFKNSPLSEWGKGIESGTIKSKYLKAHLSDALRLALVYSKHGIYMDLDFITLRSLETFFDFEGFLVKEDEVHFSNGMFGFKTSHKFTQLAMETFAKTYDGEQWSANGPALFLKIVSDWGCGLPSSKTCEDITYVEPGVIYPVNYGNWKLLFDPENSGMAKTFMENSEVKAVHLWNFFSAKQSSSTDVNNTINLCAKRSCPTSFELAARSSEHNFI